jgi:hypothetical protein
MAFTSKLGDQKRAERKMLITVAEWTPAGASEPVRTILGRRTPSSSIEINAESETTTDVLGINYTDMAKTQPQQSFDPAYIIGGDEFTDYLADAVLRNDVSAYNAAFNVYVIAAWKQDESGAYYAVKHDACTIMPDNIGGEDFLAMNYTVYFSNNITEGSVDKLAADFKFTEL